MEVIRGHTLKLLVDPEPTTLVTLTNPADPSLLVSAKVTEGLLTYDFDLNPKPQLATSWSVSADGREYVFKLRQGVKWHDGADFTSKDVAYSILLLKEVHPRGRATFASVADVEAPDAHTAVIKLARPVPYLIHALAACESPIVPRHVYAGIDNHLRRPSATDAPHARALRDQERRNEQAHHQRTEHCFTPHGVVASRGYAHPQGKCSTTLSSRMSGASGGMTGPEAHREAR